MAYLVRARLTNPTPSPITATIYGGTIFQVANPFAGVQNLATQKTVVITVPGKSSVVVKVPSWCLNQRFAPPSAEPMTPSLFRVSRSHESQADVWTDMNRRM